ncbi:transcriptional regulator, AraC family [Chryseobacterium arachidis]|uniref:Transcriptional regulator, AraC family n=1 Tax=Chryseobacterium arachidis TaxID=1416778 RepID=A0A1M4VDT7_9FLAO|nr:helix-turn-helix domain-containing protein [Chryseobacterium arachidis]SHE67139.1 transcriptional regulator, AraC family [Chryseobacterium arachidis]
MKLIQFDPLFIRHFKTREWPFPLHSHNHYELMLISEGSGIHILNGKRNNFKKNTIFFLAPEDVHDFEIIEEIQFSVLKFLPAVLKNGTNVSMTDYWDNLLIFLAMEWNYSNKASEDSQLYKTLRNIIDIMVMEWKNYSEKITEVHTHLLRSLLLIMDQHLKISTDKIADTSAISKIERIQNYIHQYIHEPDKLLIKTIAVHFSLSDSGLRQFFKNKMEMPINQYISELKIKMIKSRIAHSDLTLSQVALEFGFADASHFNKFFFRFENQNPSQFRLSIKNKKNAHM